MKVKVSAIILTRNRKKWLREAIKGVLSQTYKDFELIIIDNGSTDGTKEVVKEFDDERIVYVRNEKNFYPHARNQALELAKGEYTAICDDDDISLPERFEKSVEFLDKNLDVDMIGGSVIFIDKEGNEIDRFKYPREPTFDDIYKSDGMISTPTVMMRTKIIKDVGGYDNNFLSAADYDLYLRIAKEHKIRNLDIFLSKYRICDNMSLNNPELTKKYRKRALLKWFKKNGEWRMLNITVGVPIFNQKKSYFKKCLESIKSQSYQNFECIILDDGSDNKEEVEKITKEFGFKYIYQENAGIGATRSAIVDNASKETEFIAQLSSDDIWDKKFLEIMIETSKQQPDKILYSNYYFINEKSEITHTISGFNYESHEDFCMACWGAADKNSMFVNFSTTFFPKKVFKKFWFDKDLKFSEDLDFLLRSMKHFQYHLVPQHLLKYRAVGNLTSRIKDKIPKQNEKIRKKCKEYWEHG